MPSPETVVEMCAPASRAVLVYDVQVGILAHVRDRDGLVDRIRSVIAAARSLAGLDYSLLCYRATTAEIVAAFAG